ncbi:MAG: PDDEXK nuclease domain-containing protein [Cetobacterium sp.]|uniref:PDDEXK nuclease domain-containing protein n=1 Tax=Cetobacterium sp. TaxID=2071632 RepID=UPI003F2B3769
MENEKINELELVENLYVRVKNILENGRAKAFKVVNTVMIESYWNIGKEIVEEEQRGENRAEYGKYVIQSISEKLTEEFGKGYSISNIKYMRQFYLTFPIGHSLSGQLSWTHYRLLMKLKNDDIRNFYMIETIENNWSSRELDRQISSLLYERIKMSKDPVAVKELSVVGQKVETAYDIIKSPMVFEFLGKGDYTISVESDLESALMDKLQLFLLELGKGFSFVGRQKRINIDGDNYYIDLVFYNYILKCFVLIDLKMGKLTHRDIGQMDFYVRYYEKEIRLEGDNPTIGLLLCSDKNDSMVKYTLLDDSKNIFASKYQFYFPTEDELIEELEREKLSLELEYND